MSNEKLPVVIIGAGPVGLAAAAHLLQRGETPIVFEAGAEVGANVRHWGHVRMFSPWEYTVDSATVALLEANGWAHPPLAELPTGNDLVDKYMLPFANLPQVRKHIRLNTRVLAISRRHVDKMKDKGRDAAPFVIRVECCDGEDMIEARAVIDASGTWHKPNPIGADGLPAIGEKAYQSHIFYGIPDVNGKHQDRYANKHVAVVGSGHSAINALLDLATLQDTYPDTQITWVLRGQNMQRIYGGGEADALPARGQLGTRVHALVKAGRLTIQAPFRLQKITAGDDSIEVTGTTNDGIATFIADEIIAATGARPDLEMLRELRLGVDPSLESASETLAPMIDPNIHSCGTVRPHGEAELRQPEKDFYIVGMKSYGRAPTFLLATGYEQVRSVVAALVGDWEAARDVQLNLPETGVCSTDFADAGVEGAACCGTPALVNEVAVASVGNLVAINSLPTIRVQPAPIAEQSSDCGCDDTCCADGERSTTCGCDTTCCN